MLPFAYEALDIKATVLFVPNLCRRGKPLKVFTDFLGIAKRSCCSAYARERHHHVLSLTARQEHLIPFICWSWHQLQFMLSGEMCQVNYWKQTASGQLQINPLPATPRPESHQPVMLRGKGKCPVTDPLLVQGQFWNSHLYQLHQWQALHFC